MPAPPALIDYNDDGYLDIAFIGRRQRQHVAHRPDAGRRLAGRGVLDTTARSTGTSRSCSSTAAARRSGAGPCTNQQPIFFEPGDHLHGRRRRRRRRSASRSARATAPSSRGPNVQAAGFYYVIDSGQMALTYTHSTGGTLATDIRDLTPGKSGALGPCPSPFDPDTCTNGATPAQRAPGFVLDFGSLNEKTTSTVFSTLGDLCVVTFTPDSVSPCATNGSSFQYRFFFLTGQGGYNRTDTTYAAYRTLWEKGLPRAGQSTTIMGTHNRYFFSGRDDQNADDRSSRAR